MRAYPILLILATATLGSADTLYTKNGRIVAGTYLGGTARQVRMEVGDRVESFDLTEVSKIEFQSAAATEPAPRRDVQQREVESRERVKLMRPDPSSRPAAPAEASFTIPAGTILKVRMIDGVDSEVSQLGQTFQASLDEPVVSSNGETLVARGADVVAKLVEEKQSGKISGRAELTLDLVSIRVNGRMVDLNTEEVTTSSRSEEHTSEL